jgi:endonuclease/exonuclease/phosphatase (EEP) superfamily protein YafD
MTWTAPYVSVMRSMIDYVWIYGQDDFSIQVVDVPGSDHKGLFLWLS